MNLNFRNIIKPYPSPIITGRGIDLDFPMLAGCLALLGLGLVMITSASSEVAAVQSGNTLYMMIRHLVYLVIGLGACIVTMMIPIATWQRLGWLMLIGAFGLLIMVILPGIGREVNGSMRWIGFGAFNVQPSEIAKVFVVIYLAGYLVRRQKEVRESWMGFFKPFIVLLPMAGLLLMEPDFGATVVMMGAAAAMLFLGGVGLFRFTLMVVLAVAAVTVLVQAQPYRMARLITFTDPWSDQFGSGYQSTQALIAFGRGEWLGVGLGNSVQNNSTCRKRTPTSCSRCSPKSWAWSVRCVPSHCSCSCVCAACTSACGPRRPNSISLRMWRMACRSCGSASS